jgi:hypothetical protein
MNLALVRDYEDAQVTLGVFTVPVPAPPLLLQTLELPWVPLPGAVCGRPDRSCVAAGTYELVTHDTPRHPYTWALVNPALGVYHELDDVPRGVAECRTAVLLHTANAAYQLEGCIGVGRQRYHSGTWLLLQSAAGFSDLKAVVPWTNGHQLTITYAPGVPL